jgi:two-component system NtrC family sensor kinase
VAHEVNNPLFGILTYARLSQKELKTGIDSGKLAERLKTIERESQRCGELVKNLLGYARSAPKPVESSEVRKVVERGLGLVSYRLKTQNVALETAFEEGLPPAACEQGPLEQVILAITMNAVEAMPNGGTLRVECGTSHGSVRIAIKDTGPGISDKVLPHIFEPFFSTKEEPERTGLGLAVAKEIVEGRHGKLQARNRVSGGAEMVILLPAAPVGEEMKV